MKGIRTPGQSRCHTPIALWSHIATGSHRRLATSNFCGTSKWTAAAHHRGPTVSYPLLPCHSASNASLLRPIALWTLDVFGDDSPMLVGVSFAEPKVEFEPVFLDPFKPFVSLAELIAPPTWDALTVVVDAQDITGNLGDAIIAHTVDLAGRSATEADLYCGRRTTLRTLQGRLHTACLDLFGSGR